MPTPSLLRRNRKDNFISNTVLSRTLRQRVSLAIQRTEFVLLARAERDGLCDSECAAYDCGFELRDCAVSGGVFFAADGDGGVEVVDAPGGDGAVVADGEVRVRDDVACVGARGVDLSLGCGGAGAAEACVEGAGEVGGRG
jgi:hypothetical protein